MDQDPRQLAIAFSRSRAVGGLLALLVPGILGRLLLGPTGSTRAAKALIRLVGIRDVVLGVGALTSINETDRGPDWISMGAVTDGVDAVVLMVSPGIAKRARLVSLVAGASAAANLSLARRLADERDAANPVVPPEIAPAPLPVPGAPAAGSDDAGATAAGDAAGDDE